MMRAVCCAMVLSLWGALAAGLTPPAHAEAAARFDGTVQVHGSLRAMMHEDQTASQVDLSSLAATPHLFGVGALADLAGEVLIVDGAFYVSRPHGAGSMTERLASPAGGAALLVSAAVPAWDALVLRSDVTLSAFDSLLAECLTRMGWDTEQRLPFRVTATFPELQWHVIDGEALEGGGQSHAEHVAASRRHRAADVEAHLVGFYSPDDQGVFTHHDATTHMHCLTRETQQMGHVDAVVIPAGARLYLPSRADEAGVQAIASMLDFLGTEQDRDAIESLSTAAQCSGPNGDFTTMTSSIRPHSVYFEQVSNRGHSRAWSTPTDAWGLDKNNRVVDVLPRARAFMRNHEFHLLFLEMPERFSGFRLRGSETHDGDSFLRVDMADEDGYRASVLLDAETHRPQELVLHPAGAQGAVVVVPHVWKPRDGVQWFRGFVLTEGGERVFRYHYNRVEPNSVSPTFFERPPTQSATPPAEEDAR